MTLEVRVTNNVAQALYRKLGFQNGGIRKNYYTDNQEDALVMWVNI
jgi:[ribosomal protein S18]-alanine N-acetyltransferase